MGRILNCTSVGNDNICKPLLVGTMKSKNILREGKVKPKTPKPYRRKLHLEDGIWSWEMRNQDIFIRSPQGENHRTNRSILTGASWDELERGDRKGFGDQYAVTPSMVKEHIEFITRVPEKQNIEYGNLEGKHFTQWRIELLEELLGYIINGIASYQPKIEVSEVKIWYDAEEDYHCLQFVSHKKTILVRLYKGFTYFIDGESAWMGCPKYMIIQFSNSIRDRILK